VFPQRHWGARETVGIALGITAGIGVVEVLGALLSNSLSLLGDAVHNFIDTTALGIALASLSVLARAPSRRHTFGYQRTEVLGAWANGILLLLVAGFIAVRSVERLFRPEPVQGPVMLSIAILGLAVNGVALAFLRSFRLSSIGARAAFLHVLSDTVTSVGVIVAGVLVWRFDAPLADPAVAVFIVAFIARGAVGLLRDSGRILMEATPKDLDERRVLRLLRDEPAVRGVHDLHVWSLTSGVNALTAHVEVEDMPLADAVALKERLKAKLESAGAGHVVLEVDMQAPVEGRTS
jgi:cobalt-zinc-cadmium efflux system protein